MPGLSRKPTEIPSNLQRIYAGSGWMGFGDWLGTGTLATHERRYWEYEKARSYVNRLGLTGQTEWFTFVNGDYPRSPTKPDLIPASPHCAPSIKNGDPQAAVFVQRLLSVKRSEVRVRTIEEGRFNKRVSDVYA